MIRKAPWSQEEITALEVWQHSETVHPLTCLEHSRTVLEVREDGLHCPCGYYQDWAPNCCFELTETT